MNTPSRRSLLASLASLPVVAAATWPLWRPRDPRLVTAVMPAVATRDGAGVRLLRALGHGGLRQLDPFLLLDQFRSENPGDYIAGFPEHPHRGFETVTIMLQGAMEHRDSMGNQGRLAQGSVQWMTAGRGIVHAEMPKQQQGLMWGYQLWINLPAKQKMIAPRYQDLAPSSVPEVTIADARVRVLAGAAGGAVGPVEGIITAPVVLDVTLEPGATFYQELPPGQTAFLFGVDGAVEVGPDKRPVPAGSLALLGEGRSLVARGEGRLLLFAANPIGEPIARRGPFVMNTEAELDAAFADYRAGRIGG